MVGAGCVDFVRATYESSLKSRRSDEWINTYCIRPAAAVLVWLFYRLGWKPVWVVLLGAAAGLASAAALLSPLPPSRASLLAGILLLLKNLLDAADGQLARATNQVDRVGRFSDSISDFAVNVAVGLALARPLAAEWGSASAWGAAALVALCLLLHCSYFVFYQVSYLEREGKATVNRSDESAAWPDATGVERRLHAIFLALYGWQDRLVAAVDRLLKPRGEGPQDAWYRDRLGLRLSSFLGLGTSLSGLGLALCFGRATYGALWVLVGMNGFALVAVLYRALWLRPKLSVSRPSSSD